MPMRARWGSLFRSGFTTESCLPIADQKIWCCS